MDQPSPATPTDRVVQLTAQVTNVYPDEETTAQVLVLVPAPPSGADRDALEDWAYEHLFSLTGTGRTRGEAGYFVTVTACEDPDLVGAEFEWGT